MSGQMCLIYPYNVYEYWGEMTW